MSEIEEANIDNKAEGQSESGKFFKKEKRIDYRSNEVNMKNGQETVSKEETIKVYNPSSNIVEIDLGRDKSVRLQPYGSVELQKEFLNHPGLERVKNILKIQQGTDL
jgi:hypothetical protein